MGSNLAQLFCLWVVHGHRYCSTQAFICSIYPSVQGWNSMERFCWTSRFLQRVFAKLNVNLESQSEITHLVVPNHGIRCFRYLLATPGPSIILWQGMNFATLEHPWSMMMRILLYPSDFGRSVIRSIDTYWKGPSDAGTSNLWSGTFHHGRFILDFWHFTHTVLWCILQWIL